MEAPNPPRVQFFLMQISKNKILIRDNLKKGGKLVICLACPVLNLKLLSTSFFYCCLARNVWAEISDLLELEIGTDDESVAKYWLANKKHLVTNVVSSAVM